MDLILMLGGSSDTKYIYIIVFSLVVIFSYIFNSISNRTNIPSVILLIGSGLLIQFICYSVGIYEDVPYQSSLEILGIIGVILIVLEAVLDLKIRIDKIGVILKSILSAILGIAGCTFAISFVLRFVFPDMEKELAILYALPLSVLSSAIVIPSIINLEEKRKEFLTYESIFSDILGIIAFVSFKNTLIKDEFGAIVLDPEFKISTEIQSTLLTVLASVLISFFIIFLFRKIKSETKLFFLLSILFLFYAAGSLFFHLASLIIILIFGLIISYQYSRIEKKDNMPLDEDNSDNLDEKSPSLFRNFVIDKDFFRDLNLITRESAFLVRTFFFVVFGFSISVNSLINLDVIVCGVIIFLAIFLFRYIKIFVLNGKIIPVLFGIAPRGLITILLFFSIPAELHSDPYATNVVKGVMLFVILGTSFFMAYSLIQEAKRKEEDLAQFEDETLVEGDVIENQDIAEKDISNQNIDDNFTQDDSNLDN